MEGSQSAVVIACILYLEASYPGSRAVAGNLSFAAGTAVDAAYPADSGPEVLGNQSIVVEGEVLQSLAGEGQVLKPHEVVVQSVSCQSAFELVLQDADACPLPVLTGEQQQQACRRRPSRLLFLLVVVMLQELVEARLAAQVEAQV